MTDILLKGGRVIDPAAQRDGIFDVLIRQDAIAAIGPDLDAQMTPGTQVVDCRGKLVLPGMIDTHGHIYQGVTGRFGLEPDMCGVHSGVTTMVDQGGASCITLPGFRSHIIERSKTRILSYLSAYLVGGLEGHYYPELYRPECLDVDATVKAARTNPDIVRGLKAHAEIGGFARWGLDVMKLAAQIGRESNLPVYIHFGQLWPKPEQGGKDVNPDSIFNQVVDLLKAGDILAHPFSRHPGGFVELNGQIHPMVKEAIARGLKIDVGHGSHFSFKTARIVLDAGIVPDTLGADMHGYNTIVPPPPGTPDWHPDESTHIFKGNERFSLASAMTSMLALGLPLGHVVAMVTSNAAKLAGMEGEIGTLKVGGVADVSVLEDMRGQWVIHDNEGTQVSTDRQLRPLFCYRAGERFEADAPILPELRVLSERAAVGA
ncbi:amidohydrolase/deacetylase family metallohydrolase [Corticibacter populi]|uniref:Amidohydrolase/deacetylase family metallohydrolase n=1 Tax=Corticibacter populi TaxID=1550736 RepID=A0A3M6QQZ5_9BURK|nr:amidohydrolase/deacetylase family metallohydrolase [Corticibacter populi]RMX04822.1 amidohydrolase/deacetylase family metallohydrolase [Corticibacter populi]RZS33759.1 dihydroorotase [Corticibacter populi]